MDHQGHFECRSESLSFLLATMSKGNTTIELRYERLELN